MAIHLYITARKRSSLSLSTSAAVMTVPPAIPALLPVVRSKPISYHLLTVRLDISRLRLFLLHTVPKYCPYDDCLIHSANETYHLVHSKVFDDKKKRKSERSGGHGGEKCRVADSISMTLESSDLHPYEACYHELNDCITILSTFLSSCVEPLTPHTLAEAHYLIGLISETLHQAEQAKHSYIKALWIIAAKSTSDIFSMEVLATTLHCLGRAYGLLGKHKEALCLLRKAQQQYASINVNKEHAVMIDIQKLIEFNGQCVANIATTDRLKENCWWSSFSTSTLTLIVEDESE